MTRLVVGKKQKNAEKRILSMGADLGDVTHFGDTAALGRAMSGRTTDEASGVSGRGGRPNKKKHAPKKGPKSKKRKHFRK
jgi:hypothetical protein